MMKRFSILALSFVFFAAGAWAQGSPRQCVPVTVYVPEQVETVPPIARAALEGKMRQIVTLNGMGASEDRGQFYISCDIAVTDKQVVGGAPVKIAQQMDVTFYIADAIGQKIYGTVTVPVRGVGDNENKAYLAALRQIAPGQPALKDFVQRANARIVDYYVTHCDQLIEQARTLALAKQYEQAFFQLSMIPEVCDACYGKVLTVARELFQKYIDDRAQANLAKARSIWQAGQDRDAALEAGEYLSQILPDAACYAQAQALERDIRTKVRADVDFAREMERKQAEWDQQNTANAIQAWREVGVAYGKNQQPITYNATLLH